MYVWYFLFGLIADSLFTRFNHSPHCNGTPANAHQPLARCIPLGNFLGLIRHILQAPSRLRPAVASINCHFL
ncbi:hypothetical protein FB451DRAFT_1264293 [Mycena latifolia]|nr:hypothetical protein FB451DRAFT_1264293 [Mycena latifolia]